jgi:hypothetical protein
MRNTNLPLKKIILGAGALLLLACSSNSPERANTSSETTEPIKEKPLVFDKLVGTWQNEDGKSFERWTRNPDGTYASVVYVLNGKDTAFQERAGIYEDHGVWVFENTVSGQNDGNAVKFTAGILNERTVQFSNPAHDFPNDINYTLPDDNTVNAFIVGKNRQGGKDTIPFNYKRIK